MLPAASSAILGAGTLLGRAHGPLWVLWCCIVWAYRPSFAETRLMAVSPIVKAKYWAEVSAKYLAVKVAA